MWRIKAVLTAAALVLGNSISARTPEEPLSFGFSAGIGLSPVEAMDSFSVISRDYDHPMAAIYGEHSGDVFSCGEIVLQGEMKIRKWFALTLDLGFTPVRNDVFNGITGDLSRTRSGLCLAVYPSAKFYYMNRENVRLFGDIGLGYCRYFNFQGRGASASFQMNPIGIEFGRKLFGFLKFGFGTVYMGFQGGIGYKFGNL